MALVLSLKAGEDVFIGHTPVTLSRILNQDEAVLFVDGLFVTVDSQRWMRLTDDCEARVSNHNSNGHQIRIQFNAPQAKVLRGTAYRNPKKGIKQ